MALYSKEVLRFQRGAVVQLVCLWVLGSYFNSGYFHAEVRDWSESAGHNLGASIRAPP